MKFISTCDANMGGTELISALERAVQYRTMEASTQIIVMTDGELWDYDGVRNYVCRTRVALLDQIRFFSLGSGDEVADMEEACQMSLHSTLKVTVSLE